MNRIAAILPTIWWPDSVAGPRRAISTAISVNDVTSNSVDNPAGTPIRSRSFCSCHWGRADRRSAPWRNGLKYGCQRQTASPRAKVSHDWQAVATAQPAPPSAGTGPAPQMNSAFSGIFSSNAVRLIAIVNCGRDSAEFKVTNTRVPSAPGSPKAAAAR